MNQDKTVNDLGDIYLGAAVEEWSERQVVERVYGRLTDAGAPFLLLANFQLGGRQIDCVIVTERRVVVVEVKASHLPVRGEIDGDWARLHVSGEWRHYTNGYKQALGQKNRLLSAMQGYLEVNNFYPDAAVVFIMPLPKASALTHGDFKVRVIELDKFDATADGDRPNPWSLDDWRQFATSKSLRLASPPEVMAGATLERHYVMMRDYRDRVMSELDRDGTRWLAESEEQRAALLDALDHAPGCYVEGPSGCGKTLAARWLGARLSRLGECVLFLAAKDFDGSWARLLKRELALVMETSIPDFLGALRATGSPVRIVLDGVNELGSSRDAALRGLRALARRIDARVIVTGQSALPEQLSGLVRIAVAAPSVNLKERIASTRLSSLGSGVRALLKAAASGFEAAIVAEIGATVPADASRQLLVDQFIRQRLGSAQRSGSAGLRSFAQRLIGTTSFSTNEIVFDEQMRTDGVTSVEIDAIFAARLLVRRGGRVSFAHEIMLNACAAFAYAQLASKAGERFAALLSLPVLETIAVDIVSVIEDAEMVATVLRTSSDQVLLCEAARGLAGPIAAEAAERLLTNTEAALKAEIAELRLAITTGERPGIDWEVGTVRHRSDPENARIGALAHEIGTGRRIERYFALCAAMDAALFGERRRIFEAASAAGIRTLRSDAFRLAYFGVGRVSGFTKISEMAASGRFDIGDPPLWNAPRDMTTLTSGQLHFYLDRRRLFLDHADIDEVAGELARVVSERFRCEPYRVKLAILNAATFVRAASADKVSALVEAIQEIDADREGLGISTAIIDALKYLGGLEDSAEGAREGIAAEFAHAIGASDDELTRSWALSVSTAMFDHPYDSIYCDEFEALTPDQKRVLMRRAARSERARESVNLAWVVREVASFDDPDDAQIMREFARLPNPRNGLPQEEWGAFTVATRFLGRHRLKLPAQAATTDVEHALSHMRSLLHAIEARAEDGAANGIWAMLNALPIRVVMGCFTEVEHALLERHWSETPGPPRLSLLQAFAPKWLEVARRFLDDGEEALHHHFAFDRDRTPDLAFQVIEMYGDRGDLARLRRLANGPRHARRALDALRKVDAA